MLDFIFEQELEAIGNITMQRYRLEYARATLIFACI